MMIDADKDQRIRDLEAAPDDAAPGALSTPDEDTTHRAFAALDYQAPFLIEKLVKDNIAETDAEAEALFREVKRYLVMASLGRDKGWHMYSLLIDECWHQFILFTQQYIEFCRTYFGRYVPHSPSNAPEAQAQNPEGQMPVEMATFPEFEARYKELFDTELPDLWYDERSVTVGRHILNHHIGKLALRVEGDMVDVINPAGRVVMSVNDLAKEALDFISATRAFYVRELPGDLDDEEKVALVAMLIQLKILKLG